MSVIEVGCAVEGGYVRHSAATLHSVLEHAGRSGARVHYVHDGSVPAAELEPLARMVERMGGEIEFVTAPEEVTRGLPTEGFTGKATWYRAFAADLLPHLDRVLFLDADVVAADALAPLWETDVSEHYLAAVTNVFQDDLVFRAVELGFDRPEEYFNAGVMLLNLALIRRDGRIAAIREYARAHAGELLFRDQDALNVALAGRRLPLHPRWNCMNSMHLFPSATDVFGELALEEALANPGIRHFEGPGPNKPWAHDFLQVPHGELYFAHRRGTPWPEVEIERRPGLLERLRRRLRGGRRSAEIPTTTAR